MPTYRVRLPVTGTAAGRARADSGDGRYWQTSAPLITPSWHVP
jgi:hypothetical protein